MVWESGPVFGGVLEKKWGCCCWKKVGSEGGNERGQVEGQEWLPKVEGWTGGDQVAARVWIS